MPKHTTPRRLRSETFSLELDLGSESGLKHKLDVSLAYRADGHLWELAFVGRGKIGHGIDDILRELGVQISRAIQGRDPISGDPTG